MSKPHPLRSQVMQRDPATPSVDLQNKHSLDHEGQNCVPGNARETWQCLRHSSVLTQRSLCESGTGVFLCGSQLVSL